MEEITEESQHQELERLRKHSLCEVDMLEGCLNRMHVSHSKDELDGVFNSAVYRVTEIYCANMRRLFIEEGSCESNWLGEGGE